MHSVNQHFNNFYIIHRIDDFSEDPDLLQLILGKDTALTELLSKEGIERIIENPEGISSPWYGQLMKAPQILAYIIELDYWFEEYGVRIEGA